MFDPSNNITNSIINAFAQFHFDLWKRQTNWLLTRDKEKIKEVKEVLTKDYDKLSMIDKKSLNDTANELLHKVLDIIQGIDEQDPSLDKSIFTPRSNGIFKEVAIFEPEGREEIYHQHPQEMT